MGVTRSLVTSRTVGSSTRPHLSRRNSMGGRAVRNPDGTSDLTAADRHRAVAARSIAAAYGPLDGPAVRPADDRRNGARPTDLTAAVRLADGPIAA